MRILYILQFKADVSSWHRLGDTNMACRILQRLPESCHVDLVANVPSQDDQEKLKKEYGVENIIDISHCLLTRNYMQECFRYLSSINALDGYDIIHIHNSSIPIIGYINKQLGGKNVIFTLHSPPENSTFQFYYKDDYLKFLNDPHNTLVCVSESHKQRVMKSLKLETCPDSLVSIVNGILINTHSTGDIKYSCGTIGRLNSSKSMLESIKCVDTITRATKTRGFVVGSKSVYEESSSSKNADAYYEEIEEVLSQNSYIDWYKNLDSNQVQELLSNTACYISLSRIETFGLTVCEALVQGTPCIGFDSAGIGEIIEEGVTGYKFPMKNQRWDTRYMQVYGMYQKCLELNRESISKRAEERFNIDRVAKEYVELYERRCK